jgi:ribose-phosphate pyrophosphokinase
MATHGVFSAGAVDALGSPLLDRIAITDTVSPDRIDLGAARAKLSVITIAPLLARAIRALHDEHSITQEVLAEAP